MARAQGTVSGFGQNAGAIGSALTRSLTLPIIALGGAAAYMATQFQASMGRVAGLTPILEETSYTMESLSNEILRMSQTVPTGPVELADALYFAGSAGLKASEALQVVELSAKGAAIGMGEASDISKVLIFALNAFRSQGLDAAEAMDALTVAIREGTAEPEDLAVALGRLLPVAKEAGVTFQEVVGAVASLTNIGFPARVATVALRALFAELLAPTQQATERLQTLGLTADDVRESLRLTGPIGVFKLLEDAVHGDEDALRDILPQIRGFSAYVGLSRDRLDQTIKIMEKTTDSAGALGRAFDIISQTPGFKFAIALNKLKVAAIELGAVMIPVLTHIAAVIGAVADRIADLPNPMKTALVAFLGLAAALGPMLKLLANMGAFTGTLISGFTAWTTTVTALGVASFIAYGSIKSLTEGSSSLGSVLTSVAASTMAAFAAMRLLQGAANAGLLGVNALSVGLVSLSTGGLAAIALGVGALVTVFAMAAGASNRLNQAVDQMGESMLGAAKSSESLRSALQKVEDTELRKELLDIARSMHILDDAAGDVLGQLSTGVGDKLVTDLARLNTLIQNTPELRLMVDTSEFREYSQGINQAVKQGVVLDKVLKQDNKSAGGFLDILADIAGQTQDPAIRAQAQELMNLVGIYPKAVSVADAYKQSQMDQIAVSEASKTAVKRYADELGVSTEFLQAHLDAVGVSAVGMDEQTRASFERTAFGVDENGDAISAKVREMEQVMAEASKKIAESISGAFAGFDKVEDQVKGTTEHLLRIFTSNANDIINFVGNLQTLAARGVPGDLLSFLADQDPEMAARFVNATDKQLNRLVSVYQAQLAATDAEILKEANLQQGKGGSMVDKFVTGILNSSQLPPRAAAQIVQRTVAAFGRGDISEAGLDLARRFAQGIGTVKGITQQEAANLMNTFIAEIQRRDLETIGAKEGEEIVRGLVSETTATRAQAQDLVATVTDAATTAAEGLGPFAGKLLAQRYTEGVLTGKEAAGQGGKAIARSASGGLDSGAGDTFSTGVSFSNQFISGMNVGAAGAYATAYQLGRNAREGLQAGLSNSPKYFSFYAGQDFVDQFAEGVGKAKRGLDFDLRNSVHFPLGSDMQGRQFGTRNPKRELDLDLDVRLDRTKAAKALDWEYAVRGG